MPEIVVFAISKLEENIKFENIRLDFRLITTMLKFVDGVDLLIFEKFVNKHGFPKDSFWIF